MSAIAAAASSDFVHWALARGRALGKSTPGWAGVPCRQPLRADVVGQAAHQHRLHHPLGADALGQLVQRALVHARARLIRAGHQIAQAQLARRVRRLGVDRRA